MECDTYRLPQFVRNGWLGNNFEVVLISQMGIDHRFINLKKKVLFKYLSLGINSFRAIYIALTLNLILHFK